MGVILALIIALVACGTPQQTIVERNEVIGQHNAAGNYQEAAQISAIEAWKDQKGKIVNAYIINPVTGGLLIPPVQCMGVPASSTESLEPNHGTPWSLEGWRIPLDGVDISTTEMTGRDGTFGEPVPFRQCMTTDGNYIDWPAIGNALVIVTSQSYTFSPATVQRDFESEIRIRIAEEILERGGCVNFETLTEIPCP